MLHKLLHLLKMNQGIPDAHWEGDKLIMCFVCSCGELQDCFDTSEYKEFKLDQ